MTPLLLGLAALAAAPQPITPDELRADIAVLASDAYEGRKPGTASGSRTAFTIATELQRAGLRPGARDGGWYDPVSVVERAPLGQRNGWRIGRRKLAIPEDEIALTTRDASAAILDAPVVFAGYALTIAGVRDDLAGVDVRGAIVLALPGKPQALASVPPFAARRADLVARGAAAVIALASADAPWGAMRDALAGPRTELDGAARAQIDGAIAYPAADALLGAAGRDAGKLADAAERADFRAIRLGTASLEATAIVRRYDSPNVIGRIAGTDPAAGAVVYMAHWDHLGLCRPEGAPDRICNGAVDNASGIALMIAVARRLASGPRPARDILFVATTNEEDGLLGARAFAASPPLPIERIVAALNLDTVAIAPKGAPIAVVGRGMTLLDPVIDAVAKAMGRTMVADDAANAFVQRQDGWALMEKGVAAVMVGGAFADPVPLASFLTGPYHQPGDDIGRGLVLEGAAEDGDLLVALGRALADPARYTPPAR